jgi:hypothetical protein
MNPLMVEVIAYAPTQFFHCQHCEFVFETAAVEGVRKFHADTLETSMPQDMMKEYVSLSDWVMAAAERFGGKVVFKVIDAASVEGLFKSIRYGVRKYPTVIVDGKEKQSGMDFKSADALIQRRLDLQPT